MINKAIEKLTKEMMKLNDPFAQAIEEHQPRSAPAMQWQRKSYRKENP